MFDPISPHRSTDRMISQGLCQSDQTVTLQTYRKYNWSSSSFKVIPTYLRVSDTELCQQLLNTVIQIETFNIYIYSDFELQGNWGTTSDQAEKVMGPGWSLGLTWPTPFASHYKCDKQLFFSSLLVLKPGRRWRAPELPQYPPYNFIFLQRNQKYQCCSLQPLPPPRWSPSCYNSLLYSIVHLVTKLYCP